MKAKTKITRLFGILLAFVMVVGMLPTYQPQPTINAELPNEADSYAYTKVLWWRNLSALRPLCDAVKIEPIKIE